MESWEVEEEICKWQTPTRAESVMAFREVGNEWTWMEDEDAIKMRTQWVMDKVGETLEGVVGGRVTDEM